MPLQYETLTINKQFVYTEAKTFLYLHILTYLKKRLHQLAKNFLLILHCCHQIFSSNPVLLNSLITLIKIILKSFLLLNTIILIFNLLLQPKLNLSLLLLKLATRLLFHLLTSNSLLIMSPILFLPKNKYSSRSCFYRLLYSKL